MPTGPRRARPQLMHKSRCQPGCGEPVDYQMWAGEPHKYPDVVSLMKVFLQLRLVRAVPDGAIIVACSGDFWLASTKFGPTMTGNLEKVLLRWGHGYRVRVRLR